MRNIRDNGGGAEVALGKRAFGQGFAADEHFTCCAQVGHKGLIIGVTLFVYHGAHVGLPRGGVSDCQLVGERDHAFHNRFVDRLLDINARAGGALLPLQPKSGAHAAQRGVFNIRVAGNQHGVLAAQLQNGGAHIAGMTKVAVNVHPDLV